MAAVDLSGPPDETRDVGTQSYTYTTYGNFTYRTLEYVPGVGLLWLTHDNSNAQTLNITLTSATVFDVSTHSYGGWGYAQGLAYYDSSNLLLTEYSSNNAALKSVNPSLSGSVSASTLDSGGFGYGAIPGVGLAARGVSGYYGATPVSGSYSWTGFTGIQHFYGSTDLATSITFSGLTGGFQDITTDGDYFYLLSPTGTKHDAALGSAENPTVKVYDTTGTHVATHSDVVTVASGETANGIAYDWDTGKLYVLVGQTNVANPAQHLYTWLSNTAPDDPTALSPSETFDDPRDGVTVSWTYNDPEGDPQTQYEVEYSLRGQESWTSTGPVSSATASHTFSGGTFTLGEEYDWRVRVYDGSAWSGWTRTWFMAATSMWTVDTAVASATESGSPAGSFNNGDVYLWEVRTSDGSGFGPWSATSTFTARIVHPVTASGSSTSSGSADITLVKPASAGGGSQTTGRAEAVLYHAPSGTSTWDRTEQRLPTWDDWDAQTWDSLEAIVYVATASGGSSSAGSATALMRHQATAAGASTALGQSSGLLDYRATAVGSSVSAGVSGPYLQKYVAASGASTSVGVALEVLRRRIIPDAILVATNLNGPVGHVQDDPDSDDGLWLDAPARFTSSEIRVSFTDPVMQLEGQQEFRVLLRAAG